MTLPFNINDYVRVKLTPYGEECLRANYDALSISHKSVGGKIPFPFELPKKDEEGWTRFQMHDLMRQFGKHIPVCSNPIPFETEIQIIFE